MSKFTSIVIIYNPHSKGSSEKVARALRRSLNNAITGQEIKLVETKYAGHASELSYKYAKASKKPLIISASGDGGYNEIVNGAIKAQSEGAHPVCGLVPAGNANDHYHSIHGGNFVEDVAKARTRSIDILELTGRQNGARFVRYAHSYIGLGLTSKVGRELNKNELNVFNEMWITLKTILSMSQLKLVVKGHEDTYDSLVFANVGRMAKFLNLARESKPDDGKFEVSVIYHKNLFRLALTLLRASTLGSRSDQQVKEFKFTTLKKTSIQLDGEVTYLDELSEVVVTIQHNALHCIV